MFVPISAIRLAAATASIPGIVVHRSTRSATWADWDEELLALELLDLQTSHFDLALDRVRFRYESHIRQKTGPRQRANLAWPLNTKAGLELRCL